MDSLLTATIVEIAGKDMASFSGTIAIGSLLVATAAWELAGDIGGLKPKLLKKHLSLSTIPLLVVFILVIFVNPW
jgi:hypothetical protein